MLLAVDIGNTNIVLGLFTDKGLEHKWRLPSEINKDNESYAIDIVELFLSNSIDCLKIDGVIIASVVPSLSGVIAEALQKIYHGKILLVGDPAVKLNLSTNLANRDEIGADRLVNAIAGHKQFGGNLIIVDFGTATTFDVVGDGGEYLGGAIAPGVNLSIKALHDMTAKLPKIKIKKQHNVIGKSTFEAINSGIYYGYIGLVEGMVNRISKEYGRRMQVIFTGGLATTFENVTWQFDQENIISAQPESAPDLTLYGLAIIYKQNKKDD